MRDHSPIRRLVRAITAILKEDRRRRAEEAGKEVDKLLGMEPPPSTGKLGTRLRGDIGLRSTVRRPARVTLERITAKRVDLYSYVPPLGENIPVSVYTFLVDNLVPTKDKIEWEVI